ncbi:MAG TPA: Lacal_2735 family protein [Flavobacteriaceae bacterium]|nr:Lacal_2735 family protein [Flavobacteriaceae bacterium]
MINKVQLRWKLERLKRTYALLMKKSFELSAKNPEKSEKYHHEADEVLGEIEKLNSQLGLHYPL